MENPLYSISLGVASLQLGWVGVATALSPVSAGHFKFLAHHFFVRLRLTKPDKRNLRLESQRRSARQRIGDEDIVSKYRTVSKCRHYRWEIPAYQKRGPHRKLSDLCTLRPGGGFGMRVAFSWSLKERIVNSILNRRERKARTEDRSPWSLPL
jgi:hypothetical protein